MKISLKLTEKLNLNFIFLNPYLYFFNRKELHINARLHINFSSKVKALERHGNSFSIAFLLPSQIFLMDPVSSLTRNS